MGIFLFYMPHFEEKKGQSFKAFTSIYSYGLNDCLFQGLHGDSDAQRIGEPYLVGCRRDKLFHQILTLMVAVVGVCRWRAFREGSIR